MKRLADILIALIAAGVLLIPCGVVAVLLRFSGEGEIFFLQERIGKGRKPFKIYKFATMLKDSPNMAAGDVTTGNDPRVLPLGKFLRKTKINELPQFINVLGGSMSLVGPRPTTPKVFALYPEDFKKVFDAVPPGITGIGSIVFRDEEKILRDSPKDFMACYKEDIVPYKGELEQWYARNQSTATDFKIMFLTAWAILFPRSDLHFRFFPDLPRRTTAKKQRGKILYVINHIDWFWSHRLALAQAAKDEGYEVHVAVAGADNDPRFAQNGFTAHELPESPPLIMQRIKKLAREIDPAIIHAITLKYAFLTGLATRRAQARRIFTIAGLGYLFSEKGKTLKFFVSPLLKFSFKGAQIIVQNPDDERILMQGGFAGACALIRGSGVDTGQFTPANSNTAELPVVLMPTRLIRDKGVAVFAEAARILKQRGVNARFQIAGGMEGHNPNTISEREMEELTQDGAVEWLGRVDDMPGLYSRAALIAYPSYYREGIPKVLLEAAAMGKAIVTTDHPGCREVVNDGENGLLVPVKDAKATADAIERLLKDPALRQEMGRKGRMRAEEEFDVRLVVRQTLDVYKRA